MPSRQPPRRSWKHALILAGCALASSPGLAVAEPGAPAVAAPPRGEQSSPEEDDDDGLMVPGAWYGYQTLLADSVAVSVGVASYYGESVAGAIVAGLLYAAGAPILHGIRGNALRSGVDVALRLGGPVVCGVVGIAAGAIVGNPDPRTSGVAVGGSVGLVLGGLVAIAADAALLARQPHEPPKPPKPGRVTPAITPVPGGASVGFGGVF